ncbi:MAG TPA: response regulator [Parvularculaceae bacterium]|nr:response regulator [Parvularculaceae bacterium]
MPLLLAAIAALAVIAVIALAVVLSHAQSQMTELRAELARRNALVGAAAHLLRTNLQNVVGLSRLAARGDGFNPEATRDRLDKIALAGSEMGVVLDDALAIFDLNADRLRIQQGVFNLLDLVSEVRNAFDHAARRKALNLTMTVVPSQGVWLSGDASCVQKCVSALVAQLVKQTNAGEIRIEASISEPKPSRDCDVTISVAAGEGGQDQYMLDAFFNPAKHHLNPNVEHDPAAMLSLVLAKKLAQRMGGDITVKGAYAGGVRFVLTMKSSVAAAPAPRPEAAKPKASADARPGEMALLKGLRVLAVDDDETNLIVLAGYLKMFGAREVLFATNGEEAVRVVEDESCDLVFMDVYMPVLDGLGATERIRALPGDEAHVPIIALTAAALDADRKRCLDAGMDFFIAKPLREEDLRLAIMLVSRKGRHADAGRA